MASFSKRSLQDYEAGNTAAYRHLGEISRLLNKPHEWFLYGDDTLAALDEQRLRGILREEVRGIVREELDAALERHRSQLEPNDPLPHAASA